MPNVNNSLNMTLPIPIVGVEEGPQYATDVNTCFTLIDQHDHSSGKGIPVGVAGLNIDGDLPFLQNNLTQARSLRLYPQSAVLAEPTDIGCLYEVTNDLYYNDGAGNQIRITQSGGIAGSPGSIANLTSPASATYVSADQTFVWQSGASTAANMDGGSVILRNITASSFGLTLSPPTLSSNYTITLPALPAAQAFLTIDASGSVAAPVLIAGGITKSMIAPLGQQISSNVASFATSSTSSVDVTGLTVTYASSGRPMKIEIMQGTTLASSVLVSSGSGNSAAAEIFLIRNGVSLGSYELSAQGGGSGGASYRLPPSSIAWTDLQVAGTYVFQVKALVQSGSTVTFTNVKIIAYELT